MRWWRTQTEAPAGDVRVGVRARGGGRCGSKADEVRVERPRPVIACSAERAARLRATRIIKYIESSCLVTGATVASCRAQYTPTRNSKYSRERAGRADPCSETVTRQPRRRATPRAPPGPRL